MQMFFVLALGRSGTNFLASLLARDVRGVVHHEPAAIDARLIGLCHARCFDRSVDALLEERFAPLLRAAEGKPYYGEVNSYLRHAGEWLRRRFDPTLVHLVRDGRDFVRSAWIRPVYTEHEPDGPILPHDGDPWAERWGQLNRFERLCWYWMYTNRSVAPTCDRTVRFEPLLSDYAAFESGILQPTGLRISEELWREQIAAPRNTSRTFRLKSRVRRLIGGTNAPDIEPLPHWSEWDARKTAAFWEICGETMVEMGYDLEAPGPKLKS